MNIDEIKGIVANMGIITGFESEQFKTAIYGFILAMGEFEIAFQCMGKAIRKGITVSCLSEFDKTLKYNKRMRNRQSLYESRRAKGFRR